MFPVHMDLKPASAYLLEAVKCNCKTNCSSNRCSCVKFGLCCSTACGECKGLHCSNVLDEDEDSDTEKICLICIKKYR